MPEEAHISVIAQVNVWFDQSFYWRNFWDCSAYKKKECVPLFSSQAVHYLCIMQKWANGEFNILSLRNVAHRTPLDCLYHFILYFLKRNEPLNREWSVLAILQMKQVGFFSHGLVEYSQVFNNCWVFDPVTRERRKSAMCIKKTT